MRSNAAKIQISHCVVWGKKDLLPLSYTGLPGKTVVSEGLEEETETAFAKNVTGRADYALSNRMNKRNTWGPFQHCASTSLSDILPFWHWKLGGLAPGVVYWEALQKSKYFWHLQFSISVMLELLVAKRYAWAEVAPWDRTIHGMCSSYLISGSENTTVFSNIYLT